MKRNLVLMILLIIVMLSLPVSETMAVEPGIQVLSPKAGETLTVGSDAVISWVLLFPEQASPTGTFRILLSIDNGMTFPYLIADALTGLDTDYRWKVNAPASKTAMIKVLYRSELGSRRAVGISGRIKISASNLTAPKKPTPVEK
jgi:hypothetical protein